ncbi:MAG: glycosyltransferase [Chitinivibrionia bacterium]|nr:glycosyltransferase [Chitinivibrionia bacterium]
MADNGRTAVLMFTSERSWGGGETQVELLLRGLPASRWRVALAAPPDSRIAAKARTLGMRVLPLPVSGGADLIAARRLRTILRRETFHIVHAHSSHAHGIAFLATIGLGRARPRLIVSRRVAFPVGTNVFSRLVYARGADRYIAISAAVRDALAAGGIRGDRIAVVRSGVDLRKFDAPGDAAGERRRLSLPGDAAVIGTIGALVPNKGQEDFIAAARNIADQRADARFVIVGEGPTRERLQSLVHELGLEERVQFTGFREDSLVILSTFDCFVISSYLEGLCTSIMDAQVMGIPVVATNAGGIPDLVEDGRTGLLVPPAHPADLARAVARMLSEPSLRERCVANAKEKAGAYDAARMIGETEAVYKSLMNG